MDYDLIIIGSGWAGFNAAVKAKSLGLKTALIEQSQVGGTCLNQGCIPTKALLQSAKVYSLAKKSANFGIEAGAPIVNFPKIQERKDKIIKQLSSGMQFMLKGIDFINSTAELISANEVKTKDKILSAKNIIVATGSRPAELADLKFGDTILNFGNKYCVPRIISSNDILNLKEAPRSLLIIGGGVIGCEFASLFSALGSQVTIIEKMPQLLPGEDKEAAKKLETVFKKKSIKVNANADAKNVNLSDYELALLCIGRSPNTSGLGLEKIGVKLERDKIAVDEYLRTNIPNIFAAGDCTGKIMLAHFAAYQGNIAAENCAGSLKKADNAAVPSCIFTDPEIASIGLKEEAALEKGIQIKVKKFDFLGSGMARIIDETDGFIKIICDAKTEAILGAVIIGPRATELIAVLALAVTNRLTTDQLKNTIFAHPTLSEAIADTLKETDGI